MSRISTGAMAKALIAAQAMDLRQKEQLADEVFRAQPNLLGSVVVLPQLGVTLSKVDFALDILFVCFLAMKASDLKWPVITEDEQDRQLQDFLATSRFDDDLDDGLRERTLQRYIADHPEKDLLAYVTTETGQWLARIVPKESDKYVFARDLDSGELHRVRRPAGGNRKIPLRTDQMTDAHKIQCEGCGELAPSHDIINYGGIDTGHRQLCSRCFNAEVARLNGFEGFEDFRFEPIGLVDCAGEEHQFHFRTRLLGHIVVLEAFELRDGYPSGYQCEVVGDPEDDLLGLLARLVERLRRMLSVRHLTGEGSKAEIATQTVRGRIDCDDSAAQRTPLLVIDGREISWGEFGRMLMAFEGWSFKLEIVDRSDEAHEWPPRISSSNVVVVRSTQRQEERRKTHPERGVHGRAHVRLEEFNENSQCKPRHCVRDGLQRGAGPIASPSDQVTGNQTMSNSPKLSTNSDLGLQQINIACSPVDRHHAPSDEPDENHLCGRGIRG